jgi:hypothetical protein
VPTMALSSHCGSVERQAILLLVYTFIAAIPPAYMIRIYNVLTIYYSQASLLV